MERKSLPDAEFEIMDYIWDREPPVTTSQVQEALEQRRPWKIQTVVSLFARLQERGFLRAEKGRGRERHFFPLISRQEYLQMETEAFMGQLHHGSMASLLGALEPERVSDDDLDELQSWLSALRGQEGRRRS